MSASYLAFPVRVFGGQFATVVEGSDEHAADIATHALECHPGQRGLAPEYGLPDPSGEGIDPQQVAALIEDLEPELEVIAVDVVDDLTGGDAGNVTMQIELRFSGRGSA